MIPDLKSLQDDCPVCGGTLYVNGHPCQECDPQYTPSDPWGPAFVVGVGLFTLALILSGIFYFWS
jgi:hypothetical protein